MSQVRNRESVIEVSTVNFEDTINVNVAKATAISKTMSNITSSSVRNLITENINLSTTKINNVVKSPVMLRNDFANTYAKSLAGIEKNIDVITKKKIAVIKAVATSDYKLKSTEIIEVGLNKILETTNSKELTIAVENMMNTIQTEHNTIFTKNIASVVKNASIATGFANVKVKNIGDNISVIALNENGQSIVTDVKIDEKTQRIDLISETIGITDKTCNSILNKFDEELAKSGLKHKKPDIRWKESVEWIPDGSIRTNVNSTNSSSPSQQEKLKKINDQNLKN